MDQNYYNGQYVQPVPMQNQYYNTNQQPNYNYQQYVQQPNYTQLQRMQQSNQPPQQQVKTLNGHLIKEASEIVPKEIPMDGSISFFPAEDMTYILAKAWNSQGTIDTVRYIPEIQQKPQQAQNDGIQQILDKLNKLEEIVGNLNKELNG